MSGCELLANLLKRSGTMPPSFHICTALHEQFCNMRAYTHLTECS